MNPDTNRFEPLTRPTTEEVSEKALPLNQTREQQRRLRQKAAKRLDPTLLNVLLRPNGKPVPKDWPVFTTGEDVEIKNYMFRIAYVGETNLLLEPVGPVEAVD